MKFPYVELPRNPSPAFPNATTTLQPQIPIRVRYGDKEFEIYSLVDSGAACCIFPLNLGLGLGIDVEKGPTQRIGGLGGKIINAHFHEVFLRLGRYSWKAYVAFSPDYLGTSSLLGQRGFFSEFRVTFDRRSRCTVIEKNNWWQQFLTCCSR